MLDSGLADQISDIIHEHAALKAEVERLTLENFKLKANDLRFYKGKAETMEFRAEKAEAELDAARPLIEAVEKAEITGRHPCSGRPTCLSQDSIFAIERAALAHRASREGK